ncbi:MAG: sigma-54-dependent Fis family transcriptional regulator [Gammaproteobacteria bacterium]|nr:MAG: sigma-54-dependent Fis family transcriptional regulator [Gammaproteobacteria bacterium]
MSKPYILVVDDEPAIRDLVKEILEDEGYEVAIAEGGNAARQAMRTRRPDLTLLDIWMPELDGISLLKEWSRNEGLPCPVIMISGHGTVETAVEATRLGAYDFIEKPLSMAKLLVTVERALEANKLQRENIDLRQHEPALVEPVGRSPTVQRLREQVRRIAEHDSWVLITGESGSGKETFARYLHSCSGRRNGPFVDVGVGAIAGENAAIELFGNEDSGGTVRYGRLEQATGGTLFLDEVADMASETQTRLLSAFETRTVTRVGGSEAVPINVRIIAASHANLEQLVQEGHFREDLFYHLNVVPVYIPPLREHRDDVPELLTFYVDRFVEREGLTYRHFSVAAQNRLRHYDWPGNVRELKNMVQRLLILGHGEEIGADEIEAALTATATAAAPNDLGLPLDLPLREAREQFERVYLQHQLRECEGNVSRLAERVGMERTHLYRKLRALGIETRRSGK